MPRRLKLWSLVKTGGKIHKVILLLLILIWYFSGFIGYGVSHNAASSTSGTGKTHGRSPVWALRVDDGCIALTTGDYQMGSEAEGWGFFLDETAGFDFLPARTEQEGPWFRATTFRLPLWPLPVLWAVIWITRMIRAERRELKHFADPAP